MKYTSTRDINPKAAALPHFDQALFRGTAPDGGLYMPLDWPDLTRENLMALQHEPYWRVAARVMAPFCVGEHLSYDALAAMCEEIYGPRAGVFRDPAVAPVRALEENLYLLELFHGPTLAFKDIALQLVGRLFQHFLDKQKRSINIICATTGDTGLRPFDQGAGFYAAPRGQGIQYSTPANDHGASAACVQPCR
jgi:threonine synthase